MKKSLEKSFIFTILHLTIAPVICFPWDFNFGSIFNRFDGLEVHKKAAVSTFSDECAKIGSDALKRGGSAVDAAISTLVCESIASPWAMGIGGGFLMTIYDAKTGQTTFLDAKEAAPSKATKNMLRGSKKSSLHNRGLWVAIPGQIKGFWAAHQKYGRLPWKDLFEPTIKRCEIGFRVDTIFYYSLLEIKDIIKNEPTLHEIYINPETNEVYQENEYIKCPKMQKTLSRLANDPDPVGLFYKKSMAKSLIQEIKSHGGIMSVDDLTNYKVKWRNPIKIRFNDLTIYSAPLPGSGALLGLIMNVFSGFGRVDMSTFWHRLAETFKWAYAKRTSIGDVDFVFGSWDKVYGLVSEVYAKEIRARIDDYTTYNDPVFYGANYTFNPDHGTLHTSVLAPDGSAVSVTASINNNFGAKFASQSTGIVFNNHMDDFSTPNTTNEYNLRPSPSNYIEPFKRPLSSMVPTIAVDDNNQVRLVIGAAGGTKITTSVAQVMLLNLVYDYTLKGAMDQKRLHHQLLPMEVLLEKGFPEYVADHLQRIGHKVKYSPVFGHALDSAVTAIKRIGYEEIIGYSDPRIGGRKNSVGF